MPNIKSAKKRVLVNEKKNSQNKMIKSAVKTEIKKIQALIAANDIEGANKQLPEVFKAIDTACTKGILHKNNANNKKSKLAKKVSAMTAAPVVEAEVEAVIEPAVEEVKPAPKKRTKKATTDAE